MARERIQGRPTIFRNGVSPVDLNFTPLTGPTKAFPNLNLVQAYHFRWSDREGRSLAAAADVMRTPTYPERVSEPQRITPGGFVLVPFGNNITLLLGAPSLSEGEGVGLDLQNNGTYIASGWVEEVTLVPNERPLIMGSAADLTRLPNGLRLPKTESSSLVEGRHATASAVLVEGVPHVLVEDTSINGTFIDVGGPRVTY